MFYSGRAMLWSSLVVGEDVITAICGVANASYFAGYCRNGVRERGRRLAAAALVLVNLAAVGEAGFSQGLVWWQDAALSPPVWVLARVPLLLATALVSAIVLRRTVG